jgi:antitoxin ParD1/3/4
VRDLIRKDQDDAAQLAWLQAEIEKGRASGVSDRNISDVLKDIMAKRRNEHG